MDKSGRQKQYLYKFSFIRVLIAGLGSGLYWCGIYFLLFLFLFTTTKGSVIPLQSIQRELPQLLNRMLIILACVTAIGFITPFTISFSASKFTRQAGSFYVRSRDFMENSDKFSAEMGRKTAKTGEISLFFIVLGIGFGLMVAFILIPLILGQFHFPDGINLLPPLQRALAYGFGGLMAMSGSLGLTFILARDGEMVVVNFMSTTTLKRGGKYDAFGKNKRS
jgi:hypothetical protein